MHSKIIIFVCVITFTTLLRSHHENTAFHTDQKCTFNCIFKMFQVFIIFIDRNFFVKAYLHVILIIFHLFFK